MTNHIPTPNEPEKSILKVLFHSFVIIPFLVAASLFFVYSLFSILTYEDATPYDFLNDIKTIIINININNVKNIL